MVAGFMLQAGRAIATNQFAGAFPRLYMRLAGQTGRGGGDASAADTADYFWSCFNDLARHLQLDANAFAGFLAGKDVLEYGPGSVPGMAMLFLGCGARKVVCVDRFPLLRDSTLLRSVIDELAQRLGGAPGERLRGFARQLTPEGVAGKLEVVLHPQGLSGLVDGCDLVVSRAVLEEVNDLQATIRDMARALRPGGVAVHQVDLRSYGMHREHPLDFLIPSPRLWHLMYGNKCVPNRLRVGSYRRFAAEAGLHERLFEPGETLAEGDVEAIRNRLWGEFRRLPADELACLTFWWGLDKRSSS